MEKVKFKVFRFDPEKDKRHRFERFEVPFTPGMTVLSGLLSIREKQDGSLAFRSSCREGICGSCALHINGHYRLACETQVKDLSGTIKVRPLAHMPIIKDLFVDQTIFFERYKQIKPYLMPGAKIPEREFIQNVDQREWIDEKIDCILCGCCYAGCTMTATDPQYLGPAALAKADRFLRDSRDRAEELRMSVVDSEHGVWRCHTIFTCQKVCPKDINPTGSIANLKRELIAQYTGRRKYRKSGKD
jgi:succinate dehydrogenase iron-sulfur subunit